MSGAKSDRSFTVGETDALGDVKTLFCPNLICVMRDTEEDGDLKRHLEAFLKSKPGISAES
jgi:hypothetical protein